MDGENKFRLITGINRAQPAEVNGVLIEVLPVDTSPLPVDVRVFEEDTCLVLTVDPVMRYVEEHPVRLMTRIMETKPHLPGSVVTKKRSWYAVVHDLDAEPVFRKEWIDKAYARTLLIAGEKEVRVLGMPLLGTVHGTFPPSESLRFLLCQLEQQQHLSLAKLVLLERPEMVEKIRKLLSLETHRSA